MFRIFSTLSCFVRMGPRAFVRQRFKLPLVKFIHDTVNLYKSRTKAGVNNIREILFRGTVIALITALLVWLSIFMYIAFYYVYVPTISHERPVYLKFKACGAEDYCQAQRGICSFPSAHIQLTKRQQLLMMGQPYKIHLDLEMPESPANKELGMFMVCADFRSKNGNLLANSCRSTMLHYKGFMLDTLYKLIFSPFFVFGTSEEKQNVHVELFSDYEEVESEPVTDIYVEIQTRHIEIYSAKFLVNAQFEGLRYVMFHWPAISAALGITANLFFIAVVCMISWYQIIHSEEYLNFIQQQQENIPKDLDTETDGASIFEDVISIFRTVKNIILSPFHVAMAVKTSCKNNYLRVVSIPSRIYKFCTIFYPFGFMSCSWRFEKCQDLKCGKCKKVICAKHRKTGCNECLSNNELLVFT